MRYWMDMRAPLQMGDENHSSGDTDGDSGSSGSSGDHS
jgi:hypothetical protein